MRRKASWHNRNARRPVKHYASTTFINFILLLYLCVYLKSCNRLQGFHLLQILHVCVFSITIQFYRHANSIQFNYYIKIGRRPQCNDQSILRRWRCGELGACEKCKMQYMHLKLLLDGLNSSSNIWNAMNQSHPNRWIKEYQEYFVNKNESSRAKRLT